MSRCFKQIFSLIENLVLHEKNGTDEKFQANLFLTVPCYSFL